MTTMPAAFEEEPEGVLRKMPFDVAQSLARLGYYEAWRASLARADEVRRDKEPILLGFDKTLDLNKKLAKEARSEWRQLGGEWAKGPRGEKAGADVTSAFADAARASADHCAAMRVVSSSDSEGRKKRRSEAKVPYQKFEAAVASLKVNNAVLTKSLRESAIEMIWASAWHAANVVSELVREAEDDDDESDEASDDDSEESETDDEQEDEEHFGEDYPGASDDLTEDLSNLLKSFRACFWDGERWRGVRLDLSSFPSSAIAELGAELEAIANVPGPFGGRGLNAVRLIISNQAGDSDPLGEAARAALAKAQSLNLFVVLELEVEPSKEDKAWLQEVAVASAPLSCVRGVALPEVTIEDAAGLVGALRRGGLCQSRCAVILAVPGGTVVDDEGEWTQGFVGMHQSDPAVDSPGLQLRDGNILLEVSPEVEEPESGGPTDLQEMLDYTATGFYKNFCNVGVVTSLALTVPEQVLQGKRGDKKISKAKAGQPTGPTKTWYAEFSQRLLSAAAEASQGYFFDRWDTTEEDDSDVISLEESLKKGWVNLGAEVQIIQPTGGTHKATLVYLHGFMCDGNSYLLEPHHFYLPKSQKQAKCKKEGKSKKKVDAEEDDEDVEYEPIPGLKVVLPTAPRRKISAHGGAEQFAWYDYLTDFEGEKEDEVSVETVEEQAARIHAILDAEVAAVGVQNVFLGGASQGSCMALHAALTYSGDLGAIVSTMGHLMACTQVSPVWVARKIPIYNYIGDADSMMPWDKWVKTTWARLEAGGAKVHTHLEEGADHGECEDKWLQAFLKDRVSAASSKSTAKKVSSKKR
eukprot:TRINITY_DN57430_c0_g1_i1.p1 TRINITY_DN57430_c0_g1~~TRINITY_DN57430_c0_g1_i1.p1  ORF type:complete len:810 (-),score=149.69 TRINITY_DN57430_c0_g1_i1:178-2607(-)